MSSNKRLDIVAPYHTLEHTMVAVSEKERARESVQREFSRICELVRVFNDAGTSEAKEAARAMIVGESPQIAVRSNWHQPGDPDYVSEYRILLSAGAPTIQIIGDIEAGEPYTARLGYQDWFTRWEEFELTEEDEACLLTYACCFTFTN